jgi:hypothetical protein
MGESPPAHAFRRLMVLRNKLRALNRQLDEARAPEGPIRRQSTIENNRFIFNNISNSLRSPPHS